MQNQDYYKTLQVEKTASKDEIKKSYRRLARKYHPDVSKENNAEQKFKEIAEAYEVLKDDKKRQEYDQPSFGFRGQSGQGFQSGGAAGGFSDFFEDVFSSGGGFSQAGQTHQSQVYIDIKDSFLGGNKTVNLKPPNMAGRKTLQVKIPKGILPGQKIRLSGQGGQGVNGGKNGDLLLEVAFNPDPIFELHDNHIHAKLLLTPWEAVLGAIVNAPSLDGSIEIKIPKNTKGGQKIRLKGRGLPGQPNGNIYLVVQIVNPTELGEESLDLYQKLQQINDYNPR